MLSSLWPAAATVGASEICTDDVVLELPSRSEWIRGGQHPRVPDGPPVSVDFEMRHRIGCGNTPGVTEYVIR
jgi:hypothetical protein